jgi:Tfp pilus assembly protein PilP
MRAPLFTLVVMVLTPAAVFSQTGSKPAAAKGAATAAQPSSAAAITPQAPQTPAPPAATPDAIEPEAGPVEAYTYQPDGRRDPFLSLLGQGADTKGAPARRGEGAAGFTLAEISVRGVVESRGSLVAMVLGPDSKTYLVHSGDKLADGVVKAITPQGLVVIQDINDPLSIQKQREVRKLLRSLEDANK